VSVSALATLSSSSRGGVLEERGLMVKRTMAESHEESPKIRSTMVPVAVLLLTRCPDSHGPLELRFPKVVYIDLAHSDASRAEMICCTCSQLKRRRGSPQHHDGDIFSHSKSKPDQERDTVEMREAGAAAWPWDRSINILRLAFS
jgi:hypothetical protein